MKEEVFVNEEAIDEEDDIQEAVAQKKVDPG